MYCANCGTGNASGNAYCTKCGSSLNGSGTPAESRVGVAALDRSCYGGFWRRFAALTLDSLILLIPMILLGLVVGFLVPQWAEDEWQLNLVSIVAAWLYFAFTQSSVAQASPGQRALNLKVTDLAGQRITFARATGRHFATILSALLLLTGYLLNLVTARRQTLHDLIAGTLVYRSEVDLLSPSGSPPPGGMKGWQIALVALAGMVPIAGILAAIAIPAYADYTVRARVDEAISQMAPYKAAIEAAAASGTPWSDISLDTLAPLASPASSGIHEVGVKGGLIRLTFDGLGNSSIDGGMLAFTPAVSNAGQVSWVCGYSLPPPGFKAVSSDYADYTSIPRKYLAPHCR